MAKVLLSFLGTGPLKKKEDLLKDATTPENIGEAIRAYRKAKYSLEGKIYENRTFVASAIADHHKVDKIFMIGTPKSMWEEVYNTFYNRSRPADKTLELSEDKASEDIWFEIQEHSQATDHNSPLEVPHKEEIEKEMGGGSKVVLIKYGITEDEIRENITRILQLEQCLQPGDELIVDITHAFRSLPLLIMSLLVYLKNVTSKNIKISHIYYGMNEVSGEMEDVSPIVDLKTMLELQDWIIGAYDLKTYGNTYKIVELLTNSSMIHDGDKGVAKHLKDFSDYININYMDAMKKVPDSLKGIKDKCQNDLGKLIVNPVVNDFLKELGNKEFASFSFLYRLAKWFYERKKYVQAYLMASEAIFSYVCDKSGFTLRKNTDGSFCYVKNSIEYSTVDIREGIRSLFNYNQDKIDPVLLPEFNQNSVELIRDTFKKHNPHRNHVAHLFGQRKEKYDGKKTEIKYGATYSAMDIINVLESTLKDLSKL